jgi:hypothetical protein
MFCFSILSIVGYGVIVFASGNFIPGQTLNPNCYPGATGCSVDIGSSGSGMAIGNTVLSGTPWSVLFTDASGKLSEDNSNFYYDSSKHILGLGTNLPGAKLHIQANQKLVPGTSGAPSVIGITHQVGNPGGVATIGGTYTGTGDCRVGIAVVSKSPTNGKVADEFSWGYVSGPCSSSSSPAVITPGIPQALADGITVTFATGTGHTIYTPTPLNDVWYADVTGAVPSSSDTYIDGDDPFLITDHNGSDLLRVQYNGDMTLNQTLHVGQYLTVGKNLNVAGVTYIWPTFQAGGSGYVLTNNGAGGLTWEPGAGSALTVDTVYHNIYSGIIDPINNIDNSTGGGSNNLILGSDAGVSLTTGQGNTFFGHSAGQANTTGNDNFFAGSNSGTSNIDGVSNVFIGPTTGYANNHGSSNVFLGAGTGSHNTAGSSNIFLGYNAGDTNVGGYSNIALGTNAGQLNDNGSGNIFLGSNSGFGFLGNGNNNILIGNNTSVYDAGFVDGIAIGQGATVGSYSIALGAGTNAANARHVFVAGSDDVPINDVYFGSGINSNAPAIVTIHGTNGSGQDVTGGDFVITSGIGSGVASAGDIKIGMTSQPLCGTTSHVCAGLKVNGDSGAVSFGLIGTGSGYTFPMFDGSSGQVLQTNGAGNLSWQSISAPGDDCGSKSCFTLVGSNMFAGPSAGDGISGGGTGMNNLFIGLSAGASTTTGFQNTFVGQGVGGLNADGHDNSFFGNGAGSLNTSGSYNAFFGQSAGASSTGEGNAFFGQGAGANNAAGTSNVFIGMHSGAQQQTSRSTAVGYYALLGSGTVLDNTGLQNTAFGFQAGYGNSGGSNNFFAGYQAGYGNTTSSENIAIGYQALYTQSYDNSNSAYESFNIAIGNGALYSNQPTSFGNGYKNVAIGYHSLYLNTTGFSNNALGYSALSSNTTGSSNSAFGTNALNSNTTGSLNIAFGNSALQSNIDGYFNSALGINSLIQNTSGNSNTATGFAAMQNNTVGSYNTADGVNAMGTITTSSNNVAMGYRSLFSQNYNNSGNAWDGFNTAIGNHSLESTQSTATTNGINNTAIGYYSGFANITGAFNTAIGVQSGVNSATGDSNVFIGVGTGVDTDGWSDSIALGRGATITKSNQMVIGSAGHYIDEINMISSGGASCALDINGTVCSSDERLKKNINDLGSVLDTLTQVKTVTFNWKDGADTDNHIGFIAQDLQQYYPELVSTASNGYLQVNYAGVTPLLVQATRELNLKIADIENFATAEDTTFLDSMIAWLGDSLNKITRVHVDQELCIGVTCINEGDLQQFKTWQESQGGSPQPSSNTGSSGDSNNNSGSTTANTDTTTDTATTGGSSNPGTSTSTSDAPTDSSVGSTDLSQTDSTPPVTGSGSGDVPVITQ